MKQWITTLMGLMLITCSMTAQSQSAVQPSAKPKQFLYVLKVVPALHDQSKWGDKENDAVRRHFAYLTEATQAGRVILAGRTSEALDQAFGLVVFEAQDEEAARRFMQADPAVMAGVMTATLHPYSIALQRRP